MTKYIIRLVSVLIIVFLTVPLVISIGAEHNYSLIPEKEAVTVQMPNGDSLTVSAEELFIGTASAFMPEETNEESLRALCVMLNTSSLTEKGIFYIDSDKRAALFGEKCDERCAFYSAVWRNAQNESLELSEESRLSLEEYVNMLAQCDGSYIDKLALLFPGGAIRTER